MRKTIEKTKTKKNSARKTLIVVLIILIVCGILSVFFTNQKASWYTEAEHMARISKRIQKKYIDGDYLLRPYDAPNDGQVHQSIRATGFEVYPIYDENDRVKYALVEFQPYGYLYVLIRDEQLKPFFWLGASTSMYKLSNRIGEPAWSPIENRDGEFFWAIDEYGNRIYYSQSPFAVRGITNQKRYFISSGSTLLPATKQENYFINLYSLSEFKMVNGKPESPQTISKDIGFINKRYFDL